MRYPKWFSGYVQLCGWHSSICCPALSFTLLLESAQMLTVSAGVPTGGAGGVPPRPAVAGGGSGGGIHGRHRTQRGCCSRTAGEGTPEELRGCMRQQPNQHNSLRCTTRLPFTAASSFTVHASLAWLLLHGVPVRSKACFADNLQGAAASTIP